MSSLNLADLVIDECIPNCKLCKRVWKNEIIHHQIVCYCRNCRHGKLTDESLGAVRAPVQRNLQPPVNEIDENVK